MFEHHYHHWPCWNNHLMYLICLPFPWIANYIKHRFIYKWVQKSFAFIQSTNSLIFLQMDIFQNEVLKKFWLTSDPPILYSFHKWIYFQARAIESFEFHSIHHSSHHFKNRCIFKSKLKKPLNSPNPQILWSIFKQIYFPNEK